MVLVVKPREELRVLARSVGDAGDRPYNVEGVTVLARLKDIRDFLRGILDSLRPRYVYNSSTAAPLSVTLDLSLESRGRSRIEVWVKSSAAATFYVEGSRNNADWRLIDTIELAAAGEAHRGYFNAYPLIRVRTDAANDNEIEIVASR